MDGAFLGAIGGGSGSLLIAAFTFGKLWQKVAFLCRTTAQLLQHIDVLSTALTSCNERIENLEKRQERVEGVLNGWMKKTFPGGSP